MNLLWMSLQEYKNYLEYCKLPRHPDESFTIQYITEQNSPVSVNIYNLESASLKIKNPLCLEKADCDVQKHGSKF